MEEENRIFEDDNSTPDDELEEPINRRLVIQPHDRAIVDIVRMIGDDDIILKPPYQRNYLWDSNGERRTSKLIESILLNVPIPVVYLAEEEDGSLSVIDGYQRLNTLNRFYNDKFALKGLETLTDFNKKKYSDLEPKYQRIFRNGNIRTIVILKDSNPDIKYDIFERLNSGSVQVNEQEMRNSIFNGKLNDLLMELRNNSDFQNCINLSEKNRDENGLHSRYLDAEMVLRILTMIYYEKDIEIKYKQQMKKFLNDFMTEFRNANNNKLNEFRKIFEDTIKKVNIVFGANAFRKYENEKYESILNRSVMDCMVVSFNKLSIEEIEKNKEEIELAFKEICEAKHEKEDDDFISSITKWTSTRANLLKRLKLWQKKLNEVLKK